MYCKAQGTGYVTLKGKQFYDENGQPFFPMAMVWIGKIVCDNASNPSIFKIIRTWEVGIKKCLLEPINRYTDLSNCELSVEDDFEKIKQMGFNTVHLAMAPNRNPVNNNLGGFRINAAEFNNSTVSCNPVADNCALCASPRYTMQLGPYTSQPYNCTNCDAEKYFNLIAHILDIAQAHNLKVVFSVSDHPTGASYPEMGSSQTDADDFAFYVSALANVLKNKPALLAYELLTEPNWFINSVNLLDKDKETVCRYFTQWYDAIKVSDPNHLITTGGTDMGDVLTWDPGVSKIDFVTMHLYPFANNALGIPANDPRTTERVLNLISWCSSAIQKPWVIGETGMNSYDETQTSEMCLAPYVWGSNTDQKNYLSEILPALRDCGASGFAWYAFQDLHWYCIPDEVCTPTCSNCNNWPSGVTTPPFPPGTGPNGGYCGQYGDLEVMKNAINGNYTGLLKYGDPDMNGNYDALSVDKPAVQEVQAFDPSASAPCLAPTANYYNPYQNPPSNSAISGTVKDANGTPIKDAVILASTTIFPQPPAQSKSYIEYTFTDANGTFQIIPYPDQDQATKVNDLHISAPGAERKVINNPSTSINYQVNLKKSLIDYDASFSNQNITGTQNFIAFNSVTTTNFTFQSSAVGDITARSEVHINAEFHAEVGSEVHIYNSETFSDCSDYVGYLHERKNNTASANSESATVQEPQIELTFKKKYLPNTVSVIPNPSNGKFLVRLNTANEKNFLQSISIYDIMGKQVLVLRENIKSLNIDLSSQPQGIYFLKANDTENTYNQKIILK